MNPLVLRVTLASLFVLTAAIKLWRPDPHEPDLRRAAIDLISRQGGIAYEETAEQGSPLGNTVRYRAPGCGELGQVFLVDLGLQLTPMLNRVIRPDYSRRFIYLDRTWLTEDRLGMRLEWVRHKALSLWGLGRYAVTETALVVADPPGCGIADRIHWSTIWEVPT